MLNEIEEFKAYTAKPKYSHNGKRDTSYFGRFSYDMLTEFIGLQRVLTIIARGYLFRSGDPYDNIEYARRALCAWCSLPGKNPEGKENEWQFKINFGEYHDEFPALVGKDGKGWFYRHVHGITSYMEKNVNTNSHSINMRYEKLRSGFRTKWENKVKQLQIPLFSDATKGAWVLTFDEILSDAIEAGELRDKNFSFSADQKERIDAALPKGLPYHAAETLLAYCIANKPEDSDWTVIPVTNFDAYFGSTMFSKKWLYSMPESLFVRDKANCGVCRGRAII